MDMALIGRPINEALEATEVLIGSGLLGPLSFVLDTHLNADVVKKAREKLAHYCKNSNLVRQTPMFDVEATDLWALQLLFSLRRSTAPLEVVATYTRPSCQDWTVSFGLLVYKVLVGWGDSLGGWESFPCGVKLIRREDKPLT